MTKLGTWLTIGCSAAAVGLLVDNMRLRAELDKRQADPSAEVRSERVTQGRASAPQQRAASVSSRLGGRTVAVTEVSEDVIEARIEREVSARVDEVVRSRTDGDLEALVEERVDQRMEEQHDRRRERLQEMMEEHVTEFVEDSGHSEEIKAQMMTSLDGAMSSLGDIFSAVHNDEIDRETARDEIGVIRDELEVSMTEILGSDEAERFHENLRGPLGRRWRGRR